MPKIGKRPMDDEQLEGGGSGAGIAGTKWSNMPSIKGNASIVDDVKKLVRDTSHLKGGAKKATDLAEDRAANRMAARAGAASAVAGGANVMTRTGEASSKKSDDYEDMSGDVNVDSSNPTGVAGKGMAKGGTASSRGDGIASRGKTKGRMIAMCGGGMYKK